MKDILIITTTTTTTTDLHSLRCGWEQLSALKYALPFPGRRRMQSHFLLLSTAWAEEQIRHGKLLKGSKKPCSWTNCAAGRYPSPQGTWGAVSAPACHSLLSAAWTGGPVKVGDSWQRTKQRGRKEQDKRTEGGRNRNDQVSQIYHPSRTFCPRFCKQE